MVKKMPYLCKSCGNKKDFREEGAQIADVREYSSATRYLDENGNETDYETHDVEDSDTNDITFESNNDGIICNICHENADEISDEEWDNWNEDLSEQEQKGYKKPEPKQLSNKLENVKKELLRKI